MDARVIRFLRPPDGPMPLYVHTVGYSPQSPMFRPEGFSAYQLLFVRGGQGSVRLIGKEAFRFGPMQYMLMPPDLPHEYYPISEEPWEVGYVSFLGTKVEPILEHFGMTPCRLQELSHPESIWRLLDDMWKIGDANGEGAEWLAVRLLYGLFADLNRMQSMKNQEKSDVTVANTGDLPKEAVRQAALYLNEHFNENITLSNVAASLGYSHQYLNRLFRQTYGVSMLQYVQRIRMDKAIGFMSSKEKVTIKEIAGRVGMETNYFIRKFRQVTGMTPEQYKKSREGQER